jgi:hypothetical protein
VRGWAGRSAQLSDLTARLSASSGTASEGEDNTEHSDGGGQFEGRRRHPAGRGTPGYASERSSLDSFDSVGSCVRDFDLEAHGAWRWAAALVRFWGSGGAVCAPPPLPTTAVPPPSPPCVGVGAPCGLRV